MTRVRIARDVCAGTGLCERICPAVFEVRGGWAEVLVEEVPADQDAAVREAATLCPTEAIELSD